MVQMRDGNHHWLHLAAPVRTTISALRPTLLAGPIGCLLAALSYRLPVRRIEFDLHRHGYAPSYRLRFGCRNFIFAEPCRGCGPPPKNSSITARPSGVLVAHSSLSQAGASNSSSIARIASSLRPAPRQSLTRSTI